APMTPAASPLPIAANRALRLSLGPSAAWPTRPRVMAAIAGPSTALAPTCRSLAPQIARNTGKTAISKAEMPMPITASMAARRLDDPAAGNLAHKPGDAADGKHEADIDLGPLLRRQVDGQERSEAGLQVGNEEGEPVEPAPACSRGGIRPRYRGLLIGIAQA